MFFPHWLTIAALALPPLAAIAQQAPEPADANAWTPALGYVSAFENYRSATEEKASPDKGWRAANEEVQSEGRHSGHAMDPGSSPGSSAPKVNAAPAQQDEQRVVPKTAPHAGHAGHNNQGK
jgi:hypothetical protein